MCKTLALPEGDVRQRILDLLDGIAAIDPATSDIAAEIRSLVAEAF